MTERVLGISIFLLLLTLPLHPAFGEVTASFRYPLSNFSGPVPSQWARLAVDQERNEIYALNQRERDIRKIREPWPRSGEGPRVETGHRRERLGHSDNGVRGCERYPG